jgi:hypothetical protein
LCIFCSFSFKKKGKKNTFLGKGGFFKKSFASPWRPAGHFHFPLANFRCNVRLGFWTVWVFLNYEPRKNGRNQLAMQMRAAKKMDDLLLGNRNWRLS